MRFKVGDVVVLKWSRVGVPRGIEGTVVEIGCKGVSKVTGMRSKVPTDDYLVDWGGVYGVRSALDQQLAPKRPPMGSWDEIERTVGWMPREVA